jgi:hypothetical protein
MVILDNFQTMAGQNQPWSPNRTASARDAVADLVNRVPKGSKIAIRNFFDEVSGRNKGRELWLELVAKPHRHFLNVIMTQANWKKATNIPI